MPHVPLFASEDFEGKSRRGLYGDTVEEIDHSVGVVLDAIRDAKLSQKTMVIFTSDFVYEVFNHEGHKDFSLRTQSFVLFVVRRVNLRVY